MQRFEPDPNPYGDFLGVEFFLSLLIPLFILLLVIAIIIRVMKTKSPSYNNSNSIDPKSIKKKDLCGNCHYEPIYDKNEGLCRYCVKYT
jgi:hypothetical protein